jgi:hypothetical protein
MNELLMAAQSLQEQILAHRWRFCFIGGLALQRWGEARFTRDVDVTLLTGFGNEKQYIDTLLNEFSSRVENARDFAIAHRVLLLITQDGIGLDVALGALPFEESAVSRATYFEYAPAVKLITCSAEDLVIMKAFASRPQDWVDVEGILIRQNYRLDCNYIFRYLEPLCKAKEDPAISVRLKNMMQKKQ